MAQHDTTLTVLTPSTLAAWDSAALRAELVRGLTMTAEGLARMGVIWQELERRGEDLSDLRKGIATYLPLIAAGQLAAEAVVTFASKRSILRALEGVPLDEQRRLAAGGTLAVIDPTNTERVEEVSLANLPSRRLKIVFDDGEVRTPALQRLATRSRMPRRAHAGADRVFYPRVDAAAGTLTIGRMTVRISDVMSALAASASPDRTPALDIPEEYLTVKVRLTKEEHARYLALCRRVELPEWEMARKALRAFGLI